MDPRIRLLRPCAWEEVFLTWYESEGNVPGWLELAKERGFVSWADWRINGYARRFECSIAEWGLYEVECPGDIISSWFGGPFRTWIEKHYDNEKTKTFGELALRPDVFENKKVKALVGNYPAASIITALRLPEGRIFVIEGMHRSCALAVMAKEGKGYPDRLIFAIGETKLSELPIVGKDT